MTRVERVRYEMLLRIRDFGSAYRGRFPESSRAGQTFDTVTMAVADAGTHAMAKAAAAGRGRRKRIVTRAAILAEMLVIARTAREIRPSTPATLGLRMPGRRSDAAVLTRARGFVRDTEALLDEFVSLGLSAAWFAEFRRAVDAFGEAVAERRAGRVGAAGAQAGLSAAIAAGMAAARTLDVIVANALERDPVAFAAWRRARRVVEGKRRRVALN